MVDWGRFMVNWLWLVINRFWFMIYRCGFMINWLWLMIHRGRFMINWYWLILWLMIYRCGCCMVHRHRVLINRFGVVGGGGRMGGIGRGMCICWRSSWGVHSGHWLLIAAI